MTREEHIARWLVIYLTNRHVFNVVCNTFDRTRHNEPEYKELLEWMSDLDDTIDVSWRQYTILARGY